MSTPVHTVTTNNQDCLLPMKGFIAVISPDMPWETGDTDKPIYHLKESAIVLTWTTRQGRKVTTWVRDTLNNVWIVLDNEQ
ncbi:hypothetical protein [Akkermansia muciniphila]|uniref:hypothetical protein n=1 Tax=Akkermansia muciniphila TaxID=239935 RepID=UPI000B8E354B|nr:hypothetical protein [Akkermansia muciniphila]